MSTSTAMRRSAALVLALVAFAVWSGCRGAHALQAHRAHVAAPAPMAHHGAGHAAHAHRAHAAIPDPAAQESSSSAALPEAPAPAPCPFGDCLHGVILPEKPDRADLTSAQPPLAALVPAEVTARFNAATGRGHPPPHVLPAPWRVRHSTVQIRI